MNSSPKNIGKYQIRAELGRGVTGIVYHAHDPFLKRDLAIKVFHPARAANEEERKKFHQLFLTEASAASTIKHPHIVNILDVVVGSEVDYIVMELVHGVALQAHVEVSHLLPINAVMQLMFKCCTALDFSTSLGIIHRDLKPANIMYTEDGEIKITDFGTALLANINDAQLDDFDSTAYISPEQAAAGKITHQTDIYTLGVVMFRLLTGSLPFDASDSFSYVDKVLNEAPKNIRNLRPEIPESLAHIVHRAMEKNTVRRYATWADMASDLASCVMLVEKETKVIADSEKFNALKKTTFFEDFSDVELWEVLRISEWAKFLSGKVLVKEGDFGTSFFLLIKGKVHVTKNGKMLTSLEKGDCFGEMAYIDKTKAERSASIVSAMPVMLLKIKSDVLEQASEQLQLRFNRAFLKVLVQRLAQANASLATQSSS